MPEPKVEGSALYVPLRHVPDFPSPRTLSSVDVQRIVKQYLPDGLQRDLDRRTRRRRDRCVVVLGIERGEERVLVGIEFHGCDGAHPLNDRGSARGLALVPLERRDRATLVSRGGADVHLADARVVVVGCGAVGGHLAALLASSAIGHLLLIDPDHLAAANAFRHVLGAAAIGAQKAEALRDYLARKTPYLDVRARADHVEDLLEKRELRDANVVVLATGDATTNLVVSERLREVGGPRVVCTWLEPLGLGGHVFIEAADRASPGCLRCLHHDGLRNRADFAAPDQSFEQNSRGCGSAYTPFTDIDAVSTASMAARMIVEALRGGLAEPKLASWKGDGAEFRRRGYATSSRFDLAGHILESDPVPTEQRCETCGGWNR